MKKSLFSYQLVLNCILLLLSILGYSQIELVAKPSKTQVRVNERFQIGFYINIEGRTNDYKIEEALELPKLDGLHILGAMDQRNMSMTNNRVVHSVGQELIVIAEKSGTLKIGSAKVRINGQVYTSKPFTVKVNNDLNQQKNNATGRKIQGAFLTTQLSNDTPYMNEAIVLTVKVYARDYSLLQRKGKLETPKLNDFIIEKHPLKGRNLKQERIDGKVYVSDELANFVLFPKKPGKSTLESFELDLILNNMFRSEKVTIRSPEITINTKPLPNNAPKGFTGAVGQFKLLIDSNKKKVSQNESVDFGVELIGSGNLNMIDLPKLNLDKEIEVFEPKTRAKYQTTSTGIKGKLAADYVLVPQYGGKYSLKPFDFVYFDPEEKKYKNLKSPSLELEVLGEPAPKEITKADTLQVQKTLPQQLAKKTTNESDEKALNSESAQAPGRASSNKTASNSEDGDKETWGLSKLTWALLGVGSLLLLAAIVFLEKRNRKPNTDAADKPKSVRAFRQEVLAELKVLKNMEQLDTKAEFLPKMEHILTQTAIFATKSSLADFSFEEMKSKLNQQFDYDDCQSWGELIQLCKASRYAPTAHSDLNYQSLYEQTEDIVNQFTSKA